ncbi:zinc finger and BTB domain-containing protein ttk isoform X3 [Lycorma delicatula]|uniref:zinc finger and BTB domain-containing protein ttk isoform X3 n=1 Tax=Lycorma delicatula TaxID=130591 RepID=UPI003F515036
MSLGSQRFCLRWNNHQSNLLSVFDQLLHDEAFVDVTLAVEGQFLRAHKMVLSACSPYFQTLFVGHPDKHPIVILKDVPYADMRSLLDFMYRGEVSVDQDRLTAFLKVAESLRIKGLTEVNEERCDLPSIASSLLSSSAPPPPPPPPPHLHRIHHLPQHKRSLPPMAANPLLGSALTAPKRKRGRPRKLSGSDQTNGNGSGNGQDQDQDEVSSQPNRTDSPAMLCSVLHNAPELLEVNMGEMQHSPGGAGSGSSAQSHGKESQQDGNSVNADGNSTDDLIDDRPPDAATATIKAEQTTGGQQCEPTPSTSMHGGTGEGERYPSDLPMLRLVPRADLMPKNEETGNIRGPGGDSTGTNQGSGVNTTSSIVSSSGATSMSGGSIVIKSEGDNDNNNDYVADGEAAKCSPAPNLFGVCFSEPPPTRPAPTRRRIRRRATSSSDPAEQLTEMSVRGLNLFRYASLSEGVYKCMECAKSDILKTFKNKYSFQRHAFLYHEGHQRKVFPCPVCAKEFSRPDKMKNHMKTVHDCFMPKDCVFPSVGFYLPP